MYCIMWHCSAPYFGFSLAEVQEHVPAEPRGLLPVFILTWMSLAFWVALCCVKYRVTFHCLYVHVYLFSFSFLVVRPRMAVSSGLVPFASVWIALYYVYLNFWVAVCCVKYRVTCHWCCVHCQLVFFLIVGSNCCFYSIVFLHICILVRIVLYYVKCITVGGVWVISQLFIIYWWYIFFLNGSHFCEAFMHLCHILYNILFLQCSCLQSYIS